MATVLEYMQLATRVYATSLNNEIDVPEVWDEVNWQADIRDGFSTVHYRGAL